MLFGKAFSVEAKLGETLSNYHRYNAACAAALAAAGKGAEKLETMEKNVLRRQSLTWFQGDLAGRIELLDKVPVSPTVVLQIQHDLTHWQTNADLASIRDSKELAKLPTDEAKLWQKLWSDVAALLKEARSRFIDTRLEGELTEKDKSKFHPGKLTAGRTYVIEMTSTAFDTFLKRS